MSHIDDDPQNPESVTFFIGPPGAPPDLVDVYDEAVELAEAGDRSRLDEFLEIERAALAEMAYDEDDDHTTLRSMISTAIGEEIGTFETFVAIGFMRGHWTPILTIHLDRLTDRDGRPLRHRLGKDTGEAIASVLGLAFKARWIQTTWAYPTTPLRLVSGGSRV